MNEEQLKIIIKAETAQLQKEIQKAKKEFGAMADEAKKSTNSISSSLKNLVKGISLAAITHQIVKLGNAALNLASQLEEVQNVVNVSFGSMSAEVEQFAKNALKQFGLSELTAKKTASSYMAMANGMGLLAEDGKNMSLQLTALTGDMASFYNVTTDVAQTALASVFTGETESLKQFGIVMTEANLEAFALSQGIQKQYSAFTQAEKVALRYQYVLQATANAQGDFVRTGDSWANQTRILKEQWNSLLGILGKAVMNVLAPLIKGLNQVLSYILSIGTAISSLFGGQKVSNLSKPIQEVSQGASNVGSAFNNASSEIDKANSKAKKLANTVLGFDELNILNAPTEDTSASSGGVGIGGAGAGIEIAPFEFKTEDINTDGLVKKLKDMFSALNPYIEAFKEGLKFEELKANLSDIFADISERAKEFYESLDFSKYEEALVDYSGTLGEHINVVITTLSNMAHEAFKVSFDSFAPAVSTFINDTLPVIIEIFTQLTSITTTVISTIGNCVTTVIKSTEPVVNLAGKILVDLQNSFNNFWNKYGKPITDEFKLAIENIGDTFNKFWNSVVSPIIQMLSDSLGELWNNHVSPLVDNILNAIGELITGAKFASTERPVRVNGVGSSVEAV